MNINIDSHINLNLDLNINMKINHNIHIIDYYEKTNNKELVENDNMRFTQLNLNQSEGGKPWVEYMMRNCFCSPI